MKKKKDILFLCQYFYPEYVSSATLPFDTAKALVNAGYSVSALCGYPREYKKDSNVAMEENVAGINIKRLKYLQLKRGNFMGRLINYFSFTFIVFLNLLSLKSYKSIIVYSNPPVLPLIAALACKLFGNKFIFVCYDVYPEMALITKSISENGFIFKMMQFINKIVYSQVDKVVVLSNEMKDYLIKHRNKLSCEKIIVIPNWYEDKEIQNNVNSYLNEKFISLNPTNNLIVSYFGNMGICQDLDTILDAIRYLKNNDNIKFMFAGHGNKMQKLENTIKQEGLNNVNVYEFLHGQDFQDALNISDCFIVTLTEGLTGLAVPSKTYSYMHAGKPIISIMGMHSDISKELVENNAGYALEVGNTEKLVNAIIELNGDEKLKRKMSINVRNLFLENYTTEKCTFKYVDFINNMMENK